MTWRAILIGCVVVGLFAGVGSVWLLSLPPAAKISPPPPISASESAAIIAALKPAQPDRPVIAIIGINDATEVTDYLMPYGILKRADIGDVLALATQSGTVNLYPALAVKAQATIADFDGRHPDGADYVIVPAMSRDDDPAALQWIKTQARKGAFVIGVCAGAKVVANTGLLDGKRATTHWYYRDELIKRHPSIRYVPDRRLVVDGRVATTTGVSASMPMALMLIEAIAGRDKALSVATDLGVSQWDARHDSSAFRLTRRFATTAIINSIAFWNWEKLGIELTTGVDEASLALAADAWSRTYRSDATTFSRTPTQVVSRHGLALVPEHVTADWPVQRLLPAIDQRAPAVVLKDALKRISDRYDARTSAFGSRNV